MSLLQLKLCEQLPLQEKYFGPLGCSPGLFKIAESLKDKCVFFPSVVVLETGQEEKTTFKGLVSDQNSFFTQSCLSLKHRRLGILNQDQPRPKLAYLSTSIL